MKNNTYFIGCGSDKGKSFIEYKMPNQKQTVKCTSNGNIDSLIKIINELEQKLSTNKK